METIKPSDLSKLDPDIISFISLKNGNMLMIDSTPSNNSNYGQNKNIGVCQEIFIQKYPLQISEKLIISFEKKETLNNNKNNFNKVSKIIKNTNFSFYPKTYIKDNFSRNNNKNNKNSENISISTIKKCTNNVEYNKSLNNLINPNSKTSIYINNTNNFEENKEEDSINKKINKRNKNYKERIDKIIDNINKPKVNAVISLNIPSDIPYKITGIQKQFNILMAQLRHKKNRHKKYKGEDNYQRYYELYKNKNNKIYNGTFYSNNNRRLKYFEETIDVEKNEKNTNSNYNDKQYRSNNVKDIILNKNFRSYKDLNMMRNNYSLYEINDYNSKNHTISYLLPERKRPVSERVSFRDRVNQKIEKYNSALVCPSNIWKNSRTINKFKY